MDMQPINPQSNRVLCWAILIILLLASCSAQQPAVTASFDSSREVDLLESILGQSEDHLGPLDLLSLDEELKRYIDDYVNPKWAGEAKIRALRKLMFAPDRLNIEYDSRRTQTANETFRSKRGNCLSMTSLFVAAARYVGVDANFQVVERNPTWRKSGTTMIRNAHINATGWISGYRRYVVDFLPETVIDEKDSYTIPDLHAVTLYYNNMGAESIINDDPAGAIRYLRSALAIRPEFADAWNNMGVALRRLGRFEQAEFSYRHAVSLDSSHYTAMSNLGHFYGGRGDSSREQMYLSKVESYRAKHPYYLFFKGREAYDQRDYEAARKYLNKAIRRKRDEPEFYLALSHVYTQLGNHRRSDNNMRKATEYGEILKQYDDEQEMDLIIKGPSISVGYKATRIPSH